MANERMVPLLPCSSIDEIRDFYSPLGFEVTYRQLKPNPYLCLRREDLDLHYFGIDGFKAEDSYGSCLVLVEEIEPLFDAFAAGLRESRQAPALRVPADNPSASPQERRQPQRLQPDRPEWQLDSRHPAGFLRAARTVRAA